MSVILFPRGQLMQVDQDRMQAAGIIAVEVDDPSKVVAAPPTTSLIPADDLMYAALTAMAQTSSGPGYFVAELRALARKRREAVHSGRTAE